MKIINKIKNIEQWILILLITIFAQFVITLPIVFKFYQNPFLLSRELDKVKILMEIFAVFSMQYLCFLVLLSLGLFGLIMWVIIFLASIAVSYFFFILGKNIDAWVIGDILENFSGLTFEYLSNQALLSFLIITAFFALLGYLVKFGKKTFYSKKFIIFHSVLVIILTTIIFSNGFVIKKAKKNYPPVNIVNSIQKYLKIKKQTELKTTKSNSLEIIANNDFAYNFNPKKPRITVLIIGESLRNDYFYELLPKYGKKLTNDKNIIFFKDAKACATLTQKSLPCLLTNVDHKNWQDFLSSVNIIDAFNKAKFSTYWIDNQSLYGYFDTNYSFLAKSANLVIEEKYINSDLEKYNNLDEVLLPYIKSVIADEVGKKDKFILIHLLGSHWHFDLRYSQDFQIFEPTCPITKDISSCLIEEITNSYKNSVVYSMNILEQILEILENENSMVFFTPDHGISLGENGKIGNGDDSKPFEQISVPMFIWYSDLYQQKNPEIIANLKKNYSQTQKEKITHENVFHSVLGCSEIKASWIKDDLNLCLH